MLDPQRRHKFIMGHILRAEDTQQIRISSTKLILTSRSPERATKIESQYPMVNPKLCYLLKLGIC